MSSPAIVIRVTFCGKEIDTKLLKTIILTKGAGAQIAENSTAKYKLELYSGIGYLCECYDTVDKAMEKFKEIAPHVNF